MRFIISMYMRAARLPSLGLPQWSRNDFNGQRFNRKDRNLHDRTEGEAPFNGKCEEVHYRGI